MQEEPFRLERPKPERRKLVVIPKDTTRQGVLFTGADCLRGQQELFESETVAQTKPGQQGDC